MPNPISLSGPVEFRVAKPGEAEAAKAAAEKLEQDAAACAAAWNGPSEKLDKFKAQRRVCTCFGEMVDGACPTHGLNKHD